MKYNFDNSNYSKLWSSSEGGEILSMVVNDPDMIRSNHRFAFEHFRVDPYVTPTDASGAATFKAQMREIETGQLMDLRAPLGDSTPRDKKGIKFYTGVIPDWISFGTVETAAERAYKEKMFEANFGNDAFIVSQFVDEIQAKIDSADMTLSNMAAQLMSKGEISWAYGDGADAAILKADVPAANFSTAGTTAWTSPDCDLFKQMIDIQKKYQDLWGVDFPMQWDIPYKMFNDVFLKNAKVMEFVKYAKSMNNVLLPDNLPMTESLFREGAALVQGLFPINIVMEKQKEGHLVSPASVVHGWSDDVAVLRPAGYAGVIRHTEILDEQMYKKYGAKSIERVFSTTNNGLYTIMNTTLDNGNLKEWHTDLLMSAVPSLDEFLYHVIVDTKTAD